MGFQSFRLGDLVGPEGPAVLVGRVDNSANLQVGREVQGESMGAIPEVQVAGHLVDPEVGHPMDPEVGRLVDPEAGRLVDPEAGRLVDPEVGCPVVLEVGRLEDQVVDSSHSECREVDPEGVDRSDRHGNLG